MLWTGKAVQETPHPMNVGGRPVVWVGIKSANDFTIETGVSNVKDKSGNGNDGVQSGMTEQPAVSTINGKNVLSFDGSNDDLDFTYVYGSEATWFLVAEETAVGGIANEYIVGGSGTSASPAFITGFDVGGRQDYEFFFSGAYRLTLKTSASAGLHIATVTVKDETSGGAGDGLGVGYFDGVQITTANPGSTLLSGLSLARLGSANAVAFYEGRIAEFIIYDRVLPQPSIDKIHRYLANQWAITI